ncbi:putative Flp pilus assembly protein CpaD [Candidatus Terasakiella magnetica]|uniref:Putative Flp pilus assembly protein CpaD n=1 Tax=Candidatus Terasakiella magnetica TaxID=1867952 RepID=A0A1C3REM9_9PROT|nr:CpaD family pilus assembly lipoprotein [Candidatus Terasakiella magnetica]SCA55715.1 putative Flp pilus assembly protein CpaD [Candidatus Terasakiella magnetica]
MTKYIPMFVLASLLLSGCQTVQDMQSQRQAREPVVTQVDSRFEVGFGYGSSQLSPSAREKIDSFIMKHEVSRNDDIVIAVALQGGKISQKRAKKVAAYFRTFGFKPQLRGSNKQEGLQAVQVNLSRYSVSVPNCPDWTDEPNSTYHNQVHSNFGCAQAANLALMIGNPRDLVRGRESSPAQASVLSNAIIQYGQPRASTTSSTGGSE